MNGYAGEALLAAGPRRLRRLDVARRPALHRVHPQPLRHQHRPLLRHHAPVPVRHQAHPQAHGGHHRRRLDPVGAHQHTAALRLARVPPAGQ